jgi:hypothetical protein
MDMLKFITVFQEALNSLSSSFQEQDPACSGMNELPKEVPPNEHFPKYGPTFHLVGDRPDCTSLLTVPLGHELQSAVEKPCQQVRSVSLYIKSHHGKEIRELDFGQDDFTPAFKTGRARTKKNLEGITMAAKG